jgi:uncharacterized protein HemX
MIDFSTQQLSWVLITALGIGGTGYMTLTKDVDDIKVKVAVTHTNTENTNKSLTQLQNQLNRIEEKLDRQNNKR